MQEDNLHIEILKNLQDLPLILKNFVETWRLQIWNAGILSMFKGADAFSNTKAFKAHKFTNLAVKQVLY
jgi:hypothetical protein